VRYLFDDANERTFTKLISKKCLVQQKAKQVSKGIKNRKKEKFLRVNSDKHSIMRVHLNLWRLAIRL